MIFVFVGSRFFWKKVEPLTEISRTRRVSILDCESFRFMANSKYFYYMDLIRYEVVFRSKLFDNTVKKGMFGVLASQKIIYIKPLKRWKKFTITLKLDGSDEKWVYHRQIFEQSGQVCAIGFTKAGFWKNKKAQNMNEILINSQAENGIRTPSDEVLNRFNTDYEILKNQH